MSPDNTGTPQEWAALNPDCTVVSLATGETIPPMTYPFRYVPGCAVEYRGPTARRGSVWAAVIRRGRDRGDQYRATVPFNDGPDAAAWAAVAVFNAEGLTDRPRSEHWQVLGAALSMDGGDRYSYPVGPPSLADVLPAPAPRRPEA